jgi:guanylate kinase
MTFEPIDFDLFHPGPLIIVISGPSGVGKDAVLQLMRQRKLPLHFVVTMTSRPMRENEREGVDYFFVSCEQFEQMIARGEMLEHARVYKDYKGIPRSQVEEALASGKDVILRLDVQGAARIRDLYPEAILIFLIPSSQEEWLQRLNERKSESQESLKLRVETARMEIERIPEFDYLVVNSEGQLEQTVDAIESIIIGEHHRVMHRKVVK